MYKIRPFVTTSILLNVYHAIIYPFLLYGISVWGNACKTLLDPIHILQNKIVRMATYNDKYPATPGPLVHTPPLFYKLKILTIFDIYKVQLGKLIYEFVNEIGPTHKVIIFTRASEMHRHNTRYAENGNFYTCSVRTTRFGLSGLQIQGKHLWEKLPNNIKGRRTLKSFITSYKRHIISTYLQ